MSPTEYPTAETKAALRQLGFPQAVSVWRVAEGTMRLLRAYHAEGLGGWAEFQFNNSKGYARNDGATTTVFIGDGRLTIDSVSLRHTP